MSTKPTYDLDQIIQQLTTSWENDPGTTRFWRPTTITFSMPTSTAPDFGEHGPAGFDPAMMTPHKHDMAVLAFGLWDDLIPLTLVEKPDDATADITLAYSMKTWKDGTNTAPDLVETNSNSVERDRARAYLAQRKMAFAG